MLRSHVNVNGILSTSGDKRKILHDAIMKWREFILHEFYFSLFIFTQAS